MSTPEAAQLTALLADLADLHDEVQAMHQVRAAADAAVQQLASRLAVVEQLATPTVATPPSYPYRYQNLADWVDEVFARLAAGHRARWCTGWADHAEAHIRLEALWHTWEAAMAAAPGADPQWVAVDEWLRVRLDHHVGYLLDADGPFAGCIPAKGTDPGRCSAPPRLAQRRLVLAPDPALARLEAHRARRHRSRVEAG